MLRTTIETRLAYDVASPSHFRMHIAAMRVPGQHVASETLSVNVDGGADVAVREFTDVSGNRLHRFDAPAGQVRLTYRAEVERRPEPRAAELAEVAISDLPDEMLYWLMSTRFCEADMLGPFALQTFGALAPGVARVQGIVDWIRHNIEYKLGSTDATTTANDVFEQKAGVCRDFAHLAIALCRALNIPSRFVVGYVIFDDPPQDFHAIFEVWLGQWVMFDPTGLAPTDRFVRVGVGADAKDAAFATMFGAVTLSGMEIDLAEEDTETGYARKADSAAYVLPIRAVSDASDLGQPSASQGLPAQANG